MKGEMDNRWKAPTRFVLEDTISDFEKKYGEVVDEQTLLDTIDKEIAQIKAKWWPNMEKQLQKVYKEQEKIKDIFRRYENDKDISIKDIRDEFDNLKVDIEMIEGMWYGQKVINIIQMIEKKWWKKEKGAEISFYKKYLANSPERDVVFVRKYAIDPVVMKKTKYPVDDLLDEIYMAKDSWESFGRAIEFILYNSEEWTSSEYKHFLDETDKKLLLDFVFDRAKGLQKENKANSSISGEYTNYSIIEAFRQLKWYPKYIKKLLWMINSTAISEMFSSVLVWADENQEIINMLLDKSKNVRLYNNRDLLWALESSENNPKLRQFILKRIDGSSIQDGSDFVRLLKYPEILEKYGDFSKFTMSSGEKLEDINNIMNIVTDNDFAFVYALYHTLEYKNLNQIVLEKAKNLKFTHKWAYQLFQSYKNFFPKEIIEEVESKKI